MQLPSETSLPELTAVPCCIIANDENTCNGLPGDIILKHFEPTKMHNCAFVGSLYK
jgi:hypothetical protein